MACYHPLRAYRGRLPGKNGKFPVVFDFSHSNGQEIALPCGQCIGCRLDKTKEWAVRLVHESQLYEENSFITLTYDDKNLPFDGGLELEHFQKFMKRLRKKLAPKKIRFFHCGEYGEKLSRPHYHAILFNHDFPDRLYFSERVDTSEFLEDCWGKGFTTVGEVNLTSCAYVARYVTKKITGDRAREHYITFDRYTDQQYEVRSEYATMSRGREGSGGIGKGWLERYETDVYPEGAIIHDAVKHKPARYYDEWFGSKDPAEMVRLKSRRRSRVEASEQSDERLDVREKVAKARMKLFNKRKFEQ